MVGGANATTSTGTDRTTKYDNIRSSRQTDPRDDPYYIYDEDGKRAKRPLPGLPEEILKILKKVRRRAHMLDRGLSICGKKVGWGTVLAVVPGVGEMADFVLGALVIRKCEQAEIPFSLRLNMFANLTLACALGVIPFFGPVFFNRLKPNTKNARLFEEWLIKTKMIGASGQW